MVGLPQELELTDGDLFSSSIALFYDFQHSTNNYNFSHSTYKTMFLA